jgi:serine/threonine protein kinase
LASGIIKNTKLNKTKNFDEIFSEEENDLKDFLKKIFVFNPTKRITLKQAFEHEYLSEFREEDEDFINSNFENDKAEKISFDYNHKFQLEVALFKEKEMMNLINE